MVGCHVSSHCVDSKSPWTFEGREARADRDGFHDDVTLAQIPHRMQLPAPHPLPMGTTFHNVTRSADVPGAFELDLEIADFGTHDVWTVRVLRPV